MGDDIMRALEQSAELERQRERAITAEARAAEREIELERLRVELAAMEASRDGWMKDHARVVGRAMEAHNEGVHGAAVWLEGRGLTEAAADLRAVGWPLELDNGTVAAPDEAWKCQECGRAIERPPVVTIDGRSWHSLCFDAAGEPDRPATPVKSRVVKPRRVFGNAGLAGVRLEPDSPTSKSDRAPLVVPTDEQYRNAAEWNGDPKQTKGWGHDLNTRSHALNDGSPTLKPTDTELPPGYTLEDQGEQHDFKPQRWRWSRPSGKNPWGATREAAFVGMWEDYRTLIAPAVQAARAEGWEAAVAFFDARAQTWPLGDRWDGGPLHGVSKYNVDIYAARELQEAQLKCRLWAQPFEGELVLLEPARDAALVAASAVVDDIFHHGLDIAGMALASAVARFEAVIRESLRSQTAPRKG